MFEFPKPSELQQKRLNPFSSQAGYFQLPSVCMQQSAIRRFERRADSSNRQGILVHMKSINKNPCVDY
jgi:hypothetical protein